MVNHLKRVSHSIDFSGNAQSPSSNSKFGDQLVSSLGSSVGSSARPVIMKSLK